MSVFETECLVMRPWRDGPRKIYISTRAIRRSAPRRAGAAYER